MGAACLARTDSALFCTVVGASWAVHLRRHHGGRRALSGAARCIAAGMALLAPWFGWSMLTFGRITQDSSRAIVGIGHESLYAVHPHLVDRLGTLWQFALDWFETLGHFFLDLPGAGVAAAAAVGVIAGGRNLWRGQSGGFFVFVSGASLLLIAGFYSGWFWYRQNWYQLSSLLFLSLLFGGAVPALLDRLPRGLFRTATGAGIALLLVSLQARAALPLLARGVYPWQRIHLEVARVLDRDLPAGARVGAFNAGILGFFASRPVINLDGVVNGEAYEATARRRLLRYIDRMKITHLVDHDGEIYRRSHWAEPAFLGRLRPLARFPAATGSEDVVILRVEKAGSNPP